MMVLGVADAGQAQDDEAQVRGHGRRPVQGDLQAERDADQPGVHPVLPLGEEPERAQDERPGDPLNVENDEQGERRNVQALRG